MLQALLVYFIATYFLTGNVCGLILISYLRLRYGRGDAKAMIDVMWMWNGVAVVGAILSVMMASLVPYEVFVGLGRFLLGLPQ
jgi:hypothetical protein